MGEVDLFRKVLWSNSHLCCLEISSSVRRLAGKSGSIHSQHFTDTPAVHFSRTVLATAVTQPNRDSQASSSHKSAGGTREELQEKFLSCASLSKVKISEYARPTVLHSWLYKQAKLSLHHCSSNCIYIPLNIMCPTQVLSRHVSCLSTRICLN